eukprot:scaffold9568_cov61-Phaeocystis_antarctica.AAC.1
MGRVLRPFFQYHNPGPEATLARALCAETQPGGNAPRTQYRPRSTHSRLLVEAEAARRVASPLDLDHLALLLRLLARVLGEPLHRRELGVRYRLDRLLALALPPRRLLRLLEARVRGGEVGRRGHLLPDGEHLDAQLLDLRVHLAALILRSAHHHRQAHGQHEAHLLLVQLRRERRDPTHRRAAAHVAGALHERRQPTRDGARRPQAELRGGRGARLVVGQLASGHHALARGRRQRRVTKHGRGDPKQILERLHRGGLRDGGGLQLLEQRVAQPQQRAAPPQEALVLRLLAARRRARGRRGAQVGGFGLGEEEAEQPARRGADPAVVVQQQHGQGAPQGLARRAREQGRLQRRQLLEGLERVVGSLPVLRVGRRAGAGRVGGAGAHEEGHELGGEAGGAPAESLHRKACHLRGGAAERRGRPVAAPGAQQHQELTARLGRLSVAALGHHARALQQALHRTADGDAAALVGVVDEARRERQQQQLGLLAQDLERQPSDGIVHELEQGEPAVRHGVGEVGHEEVEVLLQPPRAERVGEQEGEVELRARAADGGCVGLEHHLAQQADEIVELRQHEAAREDDAEQREEGVLHGHVLEVHRQEGDEPSQLRLAHLGAAAHARLLDLRAQLEVLVRVGAAAVVRVGAVGLRGRQRRPLLRARLAQQRGDDLEADAHDLGSGGEVGGAAEQCHRVLEQRRGVQRQRRQLEGHQRAQRAQRERDHAVGVAAHRPLQQRQQRLEQRHVRRVVRVEAAPAHGGEQQLEREADELARQGRVGRAAHQPRLHLGLQHRARGGGAARRGLTSALSTSAGRAAALLLGQVGREHAADVDAEGRQLNRRVAAQARAERAQDLARVADVLEAVGADVDAAVDAADARADDAGVQRRHDEVDVGDEADAGAEELEGAEGLRAPRLLHAVGDGLDLALLGGLAEDVLEQHGHEQRHRGVEVARPHRRRHRGEQVVHRVPQHVQLEAARERGLQLADDRAEVRRAQLDGDLGQRLAPHGPQRLVAALHRAGQPHDEAAQLSLEHRGRQLQQQLEHGHRHRHAEVLRLGVLEVIVELGQ